MMRLFKHYPLLKQHFVVELDQGLLGHSGFFPGAAREVANIKPATLAVLVQVGAFLCVMAMAWGLYFFTPYKLSIFTLVVAQAILACGISYRLGMAVWWRWIHCIFPLAIWSLSRWQVPTDLYFYGFLLSLSLFWTTFRTQVPFYPSRPRVWTNVAKIIPQSQPIRMIDIGSGLGDLVMHIAKERADSEIIGIEIAPLPWLISKVRGWLAKSNAYFKLGNYHALNFFYYDVIFAYLSPAAMAALWEKAQREMSPGSMLISYEFDIPGVKPSFIVPGEGSSPTLYVWKI